jgi:cellulose synthase/poly-beta-1,6-N-acetylglucosamine synthase-like glycosyltransferase
MVTMPLLKRLGGWHTQTLTEDMEFSALCVMAGSRIRYVSDAIIYDEQPLTFLQSWRQRRRWSTGTGQGMKLFLLPLLKRGIKERKMSSIDLAFIFMSPALAVLSVVSNIYMFLHQPISYIQTALLAFPAGALAAAFIIWFVNGRLPAGTWKGVVFFPIFLLTWVPIKIISLVKEQKTWDIIPHTRSLHIHDFPLQTVAHD